ncbi:hypothetical protein NDU88_005439 [Pleurodeles waltl]|uniref:Secreted protein n=1 Tax=Pleurodeles waltl TaxID=8319 RepID=A0AAV7L0S9_PLEWA|nr:hypothetical protein NDU88_005439 [Pleurodeles waltl]
MLSVARMRCMVVTVAGPCGQLGASPPVLVLIPGPGASVRSQGSRFGPRVPSPDPPDRWISLYPLEPPKPAVLPNPWIAWRSTGLPQCDLGFHE